MNKNFQQLYSALGSSVLISKQRKSALEKKIEHFSKHQQQLLFEILNLEKKLIGQLVVSKTQDPKNAKALKAFGSVLSKLFLSKEDHLQDQEDLIVLNLEREFNQLEIR